MNEVMFSSFFLLFPFFVGLSTFSPFSCSPSFLSLKSECVAQQAKKRILRGRRRREGPTLHISRHLELGWLGDSSCLQKMIIEAFFHFLPLLEGEGNGRRERERERETGSNCVINGPNCLPLSFSFSPLPSHLGERGYPQQFL